MVFDIDILDARPRVSSTAAAQSSQYLQVTGAPHPIAVTERDVDVLTWTTRHGMVVAEQVCRRFFATMPVTWRRLRRLEGAGMLRRDPVWHGMPRVIRATHLGTRLADVDLGAAPLDYVGLRHQLAVLDLSETLLNEHTGAAWATERELRRDRARASRREPGTVFGRIPDGVLILPDGARIAVELDLTSKRTRLLEFVDSCEFPDP